MLQIKSIFNIPENASENSLLHFGFRKTIPKESDFTIPEVYEYHLKNYSTISL